MSNMKYKKEKTGTSKKDIKFEVILIVILVVIFVSAIIIGYFANKEDDEILIADDEYTLLIPNDITQY